MASRRTAPVEIVPGVTDVDAGAALGYSRLQTHEELRADGARAPIARRRVTGAN